MGIRLGATHGFGDARHFDQVNGFMPSFFSVHPPLDLQHLGNLLAH